MSPCHPDRVRRNYAESPAERRLTTGQRVLCVRCGRPEYPSHLAWWGHEFQAPGPTDGESPMGVFEALTGFTANVIEGEDH